MDKATMLSFPVPYEESPEEQVAAAQRLARRAQRLDRHLRELRKEEKRELAKERAIQERITLLAAEKDRLSRRVDTLEMEDCDLAFQRAQLLQTLASQERRIAALEDHRQRLPKMKMLRCGLLGVAAATAAMNLGRFIIRKLFV